MPHVLVAGKLHPSGVDLLRRAEGLTFDLIDEISEPSYAPLIDRADALILRTQPLSAATVTRAARLRLVSRHGVGYDAVDVAALSARGIPLCIVGDVNSGAVAEHAIMLILAASKRALKADRAVRNPMEWEWRHRLEAGEIGGKTLLVIGCGRIGRTLANYAAALGMKVIGYDPWLERASWPAGPIECISSLRDALARADVISVHTPKTEQPVLGATELKAARRGVVIVNTARGGIVDEDALATALASGHVAAAGIDVFADEPPGKDHPLLGFDQVILSPHIAGLTAEGAERLAVYSVQNVIAFFAGRLDPSLIVNAAAIGGQKASVQ